MQLLNYSQWHASVFSEGNRSGKPHRQFLLKNVKFVNNITFNWMFWVTIEDTVKNIKQTFQKDFSSTELLGHMIDRLFTEPP